MTYYSALHYAAKAEKSAKEAATYNYKNAITNCITEIPQDIKLELNNGTLTLKAGSKVYNGNGLLFTKTSDLTSPNANYNGQVMLFMPANGDNVILTAFNGGTVSTLPAIETSYKAYYNTSDGKCYMDAGYWVEISFPIAIGTSTTESWVSIDQVFNGFGYIGSTVFALPGVKGLIPNGRNADGSLKNIEFVTNKVATQTLASDTNGSFSLNVWSNGEVAGTTAKYDANLNKIIGSSRGSNCFEAGGFYVSSGVITSFTPKNTFHAVDRNDSSWVAQQAMPSNKYINLTLGASNSQYTAPANGWYFLKKQANGNGQSLSLQTSKMQVDGDATASGHYVGLILPVVKGDVLTVHYTLGGSLVFFRFIYAEGEN